MLNAFALSDHHRWSCVGVFGVRRGCSRVSVLPLLMTDAYVFWVVSNFYQVIVAFHIFL